MSPIAWVISVIWLPNGLDRVVLVLCPYCGAVHQHGGGEGPLQVCPLGSRGPHCGYANDYDCYDLKWPDEPSLAVLTEALASRCLAQLHSGKRCKSQARKGLYCTRHESWRTRVGSEPLPDFSSLTATVGAIDQTLIQQLSPEGILRRKS